MYEGRRGSTTFSLLFGNLFQKQCSRTTAYFHKGVFQFPDLRAGTGSEFSLLKCGDKRTGNAVS